MRADHTKIYLADKQYVERTGRFRFAGAAVIRTFRNGPYEGYVVSVERVGRSKAERFLIRYVDGDSEHVTEETVKKGITKYLSASEEMRRRAMRTAGEMLSYRSIRHPRKQPSPVASSLE